MASFELSYDSEDDVLEATFAVFDEQFCRTVPLCECAFLFTDLSMRAAWGITLYGYSDLLRVGELELSDLSTLDEELRNNILKLLSEPPISQFLTPADREGSIARVERPDLVRLIALPE